MQGFVKIMLERRERMERWLTMWAMVCVCAASSLGSGASAAGQTIAMWRFDSPAGGRVVNRVAGASSLSDLVVRTICPTVDSPVGRAYRFQDGTYGVECEELPTWGDGTTSTRTPFTMEFWLRVAAFPATRSLIYNQAYVRQAGWSVFVNKAGQVLLTIENPDRNATETFVSATPLVLGQWTHVAITYDGSHVRFFFDGKAKGEHLYAGPCIERKGSVLIGAGPWTECFVGDIAAIRLTRGATKSFDGRFADPAIATTQASPRGADRWFDTYRPTRTMMDLSGVWQYRGLPNARSLTWPMPKDGWKSVYLPSDSPNASFEPTFGFRPQTPTDYHWFRREFTLDESLRQSVARGDRLIMHIGGAAYRWQLRINGTQVADVWDAFNSYDYDVTELIHVDRPNEIAIGTSNRNGFAADDATEDQLRKVDGDFLIAPVGRCGANNTRPTIGVWGEIELWSRPAHRIDDVFVKTSIRNKRVDVDVELVGAAKNGCDVQVEIVDVDGRCVVKMQGAVNSAKITLSSAWDAPRLWTIDDPYLYTMRVSLVDRASGKIVDRREVPFGFREIWIDGENLMLNGRRLFLARTSAVAWSERDAEALIRRAKFVEKANAVRLHVGDFYRAGAFAHAADRLGILVIPESAFFWEPWYRLADTRFWTNYQNQVQQWVAAARNHPSIVMWSLSNEVLWCYAANENPDTPKLMYQTEQKVRAIDPTRPVQFDGDWDLPPVNKTRIANLHYPWEPVDHWYPTECWAFEHPNPRSPLSIRGLNGAYRWRRGEKPIVVGEFACGFKTYVEAPVPMTKYVGDQAYVWSSWSDGALWRKLIRWQADAWRVSRFAGANPWYYPNVPDHEGWAELMPLETIVIREAHRTFFSGEKASLQAIVLNDTATDAKYRIRWTIGESQKTLGEYSAECAVVGGEMHAFPLTFECPQASQPMNPTLTLMLERDGRCVYREAIEIRIRPKAPLTWPTRVVLFDSKGKTAALLNRLGVSPVRTQSLDDVSQYDGVVLGRLALATMSDRQVLQLKAFVRSGGTVLMMGEDEWSLVASKIGLATRVLAKSRANRAWIRSMGHPALTTLTDADLAWWRDDDWVIDGVIEKPTEPMAVAWRTLIDVGSAEGLNGAAVVEVFDGRGRYVLNQLNLDRAAKDPGARAMLANLLNDMNRKSEPRTPASVVAESSSAIAEMAKALSIVQQAWNEKDTDTPLIVDAGSTAIDPVAVGRYVRAGGRAWIVDVSLKNVERWAGVIAGGLTTTFCDPAEGCTIVANDRLLWGVSNEELFWATGVWTMTAIRSAQSAQDPLGVWRLAPIASCQVHGGSTSTSLTSPSTLLKITEGRGMWLVSTIDFAAGRKHAGEKMHRLVQALFANLGLSTSGEGIAEYGEFQSIDLSKYVNRGFQDDGADTGRGGWTDQGECDLRFFPVNLSGLDRFHLPSPAPKEFPHRMILANVPFEILDPREHDGKSCLMLEPGYQELPAVTRGDYLPQVKAISVNRRFDRLYSLHAAGWASGPTGMVLWNYVLHYSDGTTATIPVRQGIDVADWTQPRQLPNAKVGWMGDAMTQSPVGLFVAGLDNPVPGKIVQTIDIVSSKAIGIPAVVALTTAAKSVATPVSGK